MTRDQVKEISRSRPERLLERQEDVAHIVEYLEQQDNSDLRLSDQQAAEVRRRLADRTRETIPAEEVFRRFSAPDA